jgi:hypothetical protein
MQIKMDNLSNKSTKKNNVENDAIRKSKHLLQSQNDFETFGKQICNASISYPTFRFFSNKSLTR